MKNFSKIKDPKDIATKEYVDNISLIPGPQGEPGVSGVHIGSEPPTEKDQLWIIPTNRPSSGGDGTGGQDGFSPTIETKSVEGGTEVSITDVNGPHNFIVKDGKQGPIGETGSAGAAGEDGFSPIVTTQQIENGTKINIKDKSGDKTFSIYNGQDGSSGKDGQNGSPGQDGFSPTVTTSTEKDGTKVTINDAVGAHTFLVLNGMAGKNGQSPTVEISSLSNGTKVIITDTTGPHEFIIQNGTDGKGSPGPIGPSGKTAYQSATEGGYTNSEQQFYKDLAGIQGFSAWLANY